MFKDETGQCQDSTVTSRTDKNKESGVCVRHKGGVIEMIIPNQQLILNCLLTLRRELQKLLSIRWVVVGTCHAFSCGRAYRKNRVHFNNLNYIFYRKVFYTS